MLVNRSLKPVKITTATAQDQAGERKKEENDGDDGLEWDPAVKETVTANIWSRACPALQT